MRPSLTVSKISAAPSRLAVNAHASSMSTAENRDRSANATFLATAVTRYSSAWDRTCSGSSRLARCSWMRTSRSGRESSGV